MNKNCEYEDEKYIPFDYLYNDDDDYYCPQCGERLKVSIEKHPYGDTVAIEMLYECPNCD